MAENRLPNQDRANWMNVSTDTVVPETVERKDIIVSAAITVCFCDTTDCQLPSFCDGALPV
jgi:hypothetical protein